jgi:plasmid stability protein
VKTTLDLPDELMRTIKIRAVNKNRKLKDEIAYLLRRGLARGPKTPKSVGKPVRLPLVRCAHEAVPNEEMTPERVAAILLEEEAAASRASVR